MASSKPHKFLAKMRSVSWYYCIDCGLLALKNTATKKAMSKPCPGSQE